jgi:pimeloyl-ACP methyl ester carboxylesterase
LVRELEAVETYRLESPAELRTPTLLIVGGESPPPIRAASDRLAAVLPGVRVDVLAGQGHMAVDSAPALFAATVNRFLAS